MDKEIIEKLKDLKPIDFTLYNRIMNTGTVGGSTVFGGKAKEETDIDIIIPPKCGLTTKSFIGNLIYSKEYPAEDDKFVSCYVQTQNGVVLNLTFFSDKELCDRYIKATNICKSLYDNCRPLHLMLQDKKKRVEIFNFFKWMD